MTSPLLAKRRLGRTNMYVTPIGLGGALGTARVTDEVAAATVHRALELGLNMIDTAPSYGLSEVRIGMALEEWYSRGGRREDIVLSTKTTMRSAEGAKRSVEESLRRLRTKYIDILHIHDPDDLTPVLGPGGALGALKELKACGVIHAIGLGVRSHEFHRRCIETDDFDVSLTYFDYNLLDQSAAEDLLSIAAVHDIGVLNGSPLKGLWSDPAKGMIPENLSSPRVRELWEWSQAQGISLLALALQFCLREKRITCTLVGASTPGEIEADVAMVYEPIPELVWKELHERFGI